MVTGQWKLSNGQTYQGDFKHNQPNGQGTPLTQANGLSKMEIKWKAITINRLFLKLTIKTKSTSN